MQMKQQLREFSHVILGEFALNSKQQVTDEESNITETDFSLNSDILLKNGTNELNVVLIEIICTKCGAPMVKRTAKRVIIKGTNFGVVHVIQSVDLFWI